MLPHCNRLWNYHASDEHHFRFVPRMTCAMTLTDLLGQLVGTFTDYFNPGTTVTRAEFQADINRQALLIVYLFISKFVMSYISMV